MNEFSDRLLRKYLLTLGAFAGLCCGLAFGQNSAGTNGVGTVPPPPNADMKAPVPSGKDQATHVLWKIHQTNLMEIDAGKLAQDKAVRVDVKDYGKTLVKDHTDADKKVMNLARAQGMLLDVPGAATAEMKQNMDKDKADADHLKTLSGGDFDRQFVKSMKQGHDKAIAELTADQKQVTVAPVATLVKEILPVLQKHDRIAAQLDQTLTPPPRLGE